MTEVEALATMKRKCKILTEVFNDGELIGFLNDYAVKDPQPDPLPENYTPTASYDIRRSIYDALTSALTVVEDMMSRGGVYINRYDLIRIRRSYATAGVISCARN